MSHSLMTDRARRVWQLANVEAQRFNHEYIGTEHLLLGLIREGTGVGACVLKDLQIADVVEKKLREIVTPGPAIITMGKLPETPRAKKVIEHATEWRRQLGHRFIGTEHILLGLASETEGVAAVVLGQSGVSIDTIKQRVLQYVGRERFEEEAAALPRETLSISAIPPILRAIIDGNWVRLSNGRIEIKPAEPPAAVASAETSASYVAEIMCVESVIENEIRMKCTQKQIAQTYALALRSSYPTDWKKVNEMIIERWSFSGLNRIKEMAHSGKCFELKKGTENK